MTKVERVSIMHFITLDSETDFGGWRIAARNLVLNDVKPADVTWRVNDNEPELFAAHAEPLPPEPARANASFNVPAKFVELAQSAILHRDIQRFAILYRLLWRLRGHPDLMLVATDLDVALASTMAKAVRRDEHKMHAFVRFREVGRETEHETVGAERHRLDAALRPAVRSRARRMGRGDAGTGAVGLSVLCHISNRDDQGDKAADQHDPHDDDQNSERAHRVSSAVRDQRAVNAHASVPTSRRQRADSGSRSRIAPEDAGDRLDRALQRQSAGAVAQPPQAADPRRRGRKRRRRMLRDPAQRGQSRRDSSPSRCRNPKPPSRNRSRSRSISASRMRI